MKFFRFLFLGALFFLFSFQNIVWADEYKVSVRQVHEKSRIYTETCFTKDIICHVKVGLVSEDKKEEVFIDTGLHFVTGSADVFFKLNGKNLSTHHGKNIFFMSVGDSGISSEEVTLYVSHPLEKDDPDTSLVLRLLNKKIVSLEISILKVNSNADRSDGKI